MSSDVSFILELLSTACAKRFYSNCSRLRHLDSLPSPTPVKPPCARSNAFGCLQLVSIQCSETLHDIRKFVMPFANLIRVDISPWRQNILRLNLFNFRSLAQPCVALFNHFPSFSSPFNLFRLVTRRLLLFFIRKYVGIANQTFVFSTAFKRPCVCSNSFCSLPATSI